MLSNSVIDAIHESPQRAVARTSSVAGSRSQNRQAGEKAEGTQIAPERKSAIPPESTNAGTRVLPSFPKEDSFNKTSYPETGQNLAGMGENEASTPQPLTIVELRYLSTMSGSIQKTYGGVPDNSMLNLFA